MMAIIYSHKIIWISKRIRFQSPYLIQLLLCVVYVQECKVYTWEWLSDSVKPAGVNRAALRPGEHHCRRAWPPVLSPHVSESRTGQQLG